MLVTAWAELSVALLLTGREPPKLNDRGALWSELTSMRLPPDAAKRDAAIIEAVCKAVDARPECMYAASPDAPATMKRYLIDQMLTQARGGRVGNIDVRLDLALPHGYYSRVLDVVEHAMIPGRLESSERFERFFSEVVCDVIGSKKQTIKIVGRDAAEQKSNLEKLERESLAAIHSAVTAATKGSATREDLRLARLALARLVGRPDDENGVALVREKLKLGGEEVTAFEQLRASMPTEELIRVGAQNFSILAMHEEINQAKRTLHETAKAVDLSSWSRREYRGEDFTVKSGLAKDQLALLRERQQRKIEE
ncbi:MAG TPA: hypothetical protein VFM05_14590, partial [Candidatus Saccharimonadales bacterium]|nr:hypothetical protein [Candidatus Saccharimonadales bacterium]